MSWRWAVGHCRGTGGEDEEFIAEAGEPPRSWSWKGARVECLGLGLDPAHRALTAREEEEGMEVGGEDRV